MLFLTHVVYMKKKYLKVMRTDYVKGDTCFAAHERCGVGCSQSECKNWINKNDSYNCTLIAARYPMTLHDIGAIFGLTRMRICQIEKLAKQKVNLMLRNSNKKLFE